MKKRIISILLCLCVVMALLPTAFAADDRTYVKAMDLTIELPQAGMTQKEGQALKLLSAKTPYGDLAASGAVTLLKLTWKGEFDKTDKSNPKFQAGIKIATDRANQTTANNVYLQYGSGKTITVGEMSSGAKIGVTSGGGTTLREGNSVTVSAANTNNGSYVSSQYFTSDDPAIELFCGTDNKLQLKMKTAESLYDVNTTAPSNGSFVVDVKDSESNDRAVASAEVKQRPKQKQHKESKRIKILPSRCTSRNGKISFLWYFIFTVYYLYRW